jgi:hypothetical protein
MWQELKSNLDKSEKKYVLRRQNIVTLDITYGTIGIKEEHAREIVNRSNKEDNDYHMWYEEKI